MIRRGVAVLAFVVMTGLVACGSGSNKTYVVPSAAMEPAYSIGDKVQADPNAYNTQAPQVGDVVIFHPPTGAVSGSECGVRRVPTKGCPQSSGTPALSEQ